MEQLNSSRPVHEIRIGSVKAAVWRNETAMGPRFNATLSRLYKEGDDWRSTDSLGRDDLLTAAKVLDLVHTWIIGQPVE